MKLALDTLNGASATSFAEALAGIYEHGRWVAEAVAGRRPFGSLAALRAAMEEAVAKAGTERQLALITGHPDLAGKAARAGDMTEASRGEQASAGLDRLSDDEFATFHRLNDAYKAKFGFPFIVCVKRHGKESILNAFTTRLDHDAAAEGATALAEIHRIAALRLADTVEAPDALPVHGRLSTHVLDTHLGRPAAGVKLALFELSRHSHARPVAEAITNADGRTDTPLIAGRPLPIARYELRFFVGPYFAGRGVPVTEPPFLDEVPIRFAIAEPEGHYHVPLLVTPWSYSTYRGS